MSGARGPSLAGLGSPADQSLPQDGAVDQWVRE